MAVIAYVFNTCVELYSLVIIIWVVMSWLIGFEVLSPRNQLVDAVWRTCSALVEPALRPIRRVLPNLGGIDISPVILIIGVQALSIGMNTYVF